eukprot:scaffold170089_cov15-Tisochrysis_lutea.AAC.1
MCGTCAQVLRDREEGLPGVAKPGSRGSNALASPPAGSGGAGEHIVHQIWNGMQVNASELQGNYASASPAASGGVSVESLRQL